jgi:hypothetical protein
LKANFLNDDDDDDDDDAERDEKLREQFAADCRKNCRNIVERNEKDLSEFS